MHFPALLFGGAVARTDIKQNFHKKEAKGRQKRSKKEIKKSSRILQRGKKLPKIAKRAKKQT